MENNNTGIKTLAAIAGLSLVSGCASLLSISPNATDWQPAESTPGVQFVFQREDLKTHDSPPRIAYRVKTEGFTRDKEYKLWMRRVDEDPVEMHLLKADMAGDLISENNWRINNARFEYEEMEPGEPIEYAIISSDGKIKAYAHVVPFPLEAKSKGPCHLSLEISSKRDLTYLAVGTGFSPNEMVETSQEYADGEHYETEVLTNQRGELYEHLSALGSDNNPRHFVYAIKTPQCQVKISH